MRMLNVFHAVLTILRLHFCPAHCLNILTECGERSLHILLQCCCFRVSPGERGAVLPVQFGLAKTPETAWFLTPPERSWLADRQLQERKVRSEKDASLGNMWGAPMLHTSCSCDSFRAWTMPGVCDFSS